MTAGSALLDAGPLVSFLASASQYHSWAVAEWKRTRSPLLTCEPVLTEAAFILRRDGRNAEELFELLARGVIRIALSIEKEQADLKVLMHRYRNSCRWPMHALSGSLNSTPRPKCSLWTPISAPTGGMETKSFRS